MSRPLKQARETNLHEWILPFFYSSSWLSLMISHDEEEQPMPAMAIELLTNF